MFGKGRRLFSLASAGLILIALLHGIGHFQPPPGDMMTVALYAAMRSYEVDVGIGSPSMLNVVDSLNLGASVLLAWAGALNLVVARYVPVGDRAIRTVCTLNILMSWSLASVFFWYEVLPPAISLAVVATLFTIARFRVRLSHPHL